MIQGSPTIAITKTGGSKIVKQADLDTGAKELTKGLEFLILYPIAMANISYRF
jgi:hypothetical protein